MENKENIKKSNHLSKGNILFGIILITLLLMGVTNFFVTGNVISVFQGNENIQIVKMKVQGSSYILEPSTIKKGVPVRMEADMTKIVGCSQSIVISAFNIRKTVSISDNTIEFTPDKAGTFNIACSMNMYKGTFTVLESDGTKVDYIEPAKTGGTCGGSRGGCGCGG
jgi:plastocyanin domain-containing protein